VASRNRIRTLVEQLQAFPMGHTTDLVMALWFAELGCREVFKRAAVPMFDERVRLPARLARMRRVVDFANKQVRGVTNEDMELGPGRVLHPGDRLPSEKRLVNVSGSIWMP